MSQSPGSKKYVFQSLEKPKYKEEYSTLESYAFTPFHVTLRVYMDADRDPEDWEIYVRGSTPFQAGLTAWTLFRFIELAETGRSTQGRYPKFVESDTARGVRTGDANGISELEWTEKLRFCLAQPAGRKRTLGGSHINDPITCFRIVPENWVPGVGAVDTKKLYIPPAGSSLILPK